MKKKLKMKKVITQCKECGADKECDEPIELPFLDALGHEIDFSHLILWMKPVFCAVSGDITLNSDRPIGYTPTLMVQQERKCDMGEGLWDINAMDMATGYYRTFRGWYGDHCKEIYSLNITLEEHSAAEARE
jgi:hypothetical protein